MRFPFLFSLPLLLGAAAFGGPDHSISGILQRVEQAKFYPLWARSRGIEGRVVLQLTLRADGSVSTVKILRSSGSSVLDRAAVEALQKAAPYPVILDWPGTLTLELSITYRLEGS